jgi:ABC-type tungstate transport system permease subunit
MVVMRQKLAAAILIGSAIFAGGPSRADETIVLASTTSVENSGLLAHILPEFTKATGISVHVLAQGTGQALATAAHGDADLVLVHDPEAEQQFIAQGHGVDRLNIAAAMRAYTLSDRGSWLSFGNKGDLTVLVEGDPRLLNRYDVILLDPKKHPEAKQEPARRFADWLASPEGQTAIGAYGVNGEQLFHPSADAPK